MGLFNNVLDTFHSGVGAAILPAQDEHYSVGEQPGHADSTSW